MTYPELLTIHCRHCGPIATTDAAVIRGTVDTIVALRLGHAPLGAIACPLCHDEVKARDVDVHDELARFDAAVRR